MQGLLIGIANAITGMRRGGVSPAATIFAAYKARVIADGGVVENDVCTIAFLESIGAAPAPPVTFLTWGTATLKNWGSASGVVWGGGAPPAFDADYQAVLDYGTAQGYTLPSGGQQTLQNDLLVALKAAGVWSKLDTFGVWATDGNSDFALIDWIRLTDYTAINSPLFTTNVGFKGDGLSSYVNSNYNPAVDGINLTLDNVSFGYYQAVARTSANGAENAWGIGTSTGIWIRPLAPPRVYINNSAAGNLPATSLNFNANQLVSANRPDNSTLNVYSDGVLINTDSTKFSSYLNTYDFLAFKSTTTVYTDLTLSMVYAGGDLTAEAAAFYNAWNTYRTSI